MFPLVHCKDLQHFIDLCKERKCKSIYLSINHDRRQQQVGPNEVLPVLFLSMHMTAMYKDTDTKAVVLARFWTVDLLARGNEQVVTEAEARFRFLWHLKAVEFATGAKVLRGYVTWLGDPACVPGGMDLFAVQNKELMEKAAKELAASGVQPPEEKKPENTMEPTGAERPPLAVVEGDEDELKIEGAELSEQ